LPQERMEERVTMRKGWIVQVVGSAAAVFMAVTIAQTPEPLSIAKMGHVFAGGKYSDVKGKKIMSGQIYAEFMIPAKRTSPYPVVLVHGGGTTGTIYMQTPDGREGWAQYFLRKGFAVYVVDQPGRGRSPYVSDLYGPLPGAGTPENVKRNQTATARYKLWPQAHLHTQFPGAGVDGDPTFDAHWASVEPGIRDYVLNATLNRDGLVALFEKIGPGILITHSQSGTPSWAVADARPDLVKALIPIEPGLPFKDIEFVGAPKWFETEPEVKRPWGLSPLPLHYSPPAPNPGDIVAVEQEKPDAPDLAKCWVQKEPARQLVNLQKVPILMVTGEASLHAPTDHCFPKVLKQAGVQATWIRLADVGVRGNGHAMMLEKNNVQVADVLHGWLTKTLSSTSAKK
jgi:pimeloyl-ACP methyl ester carboxylesterase